MYSIACNKYGKIIHLDPVQSTILIVANEIQNLVENILKTLFIIIIY